MAKDIENREGESDKVDEGDVYTMCIDNDEKLLTPTEQKIGRNHPKWLIFYQAYIDTHDVEKAYSIAYPDRAPGRSLRYSAKKLLQKIDSMLGYRQVMDGEKLTDRVLAQKGGKLLDADSEHVQARVFDSLIKARGWHRDVGNEQTGVQIVIMRAAPTDGMDDIQDARVVDPREQDPDNPVYFNNIPEETRAENSEIGKVAAKYRPESIMD